MATESRDTIFALASGAGRSAIAVIRMSGAGVRFAFETFCGLVPPPRVARLRALRDPDTGERLDEAIILFFPGPRSETGEDCGEFQIHGSRAVIAGLLNRLGRLPGFRAAEPGEFARRALMNGKMDLLDLEALADLIDAETDLQRRVALEGGGVLLRGTAERWRELLLDIRAELEAGIDFSDEDDVGRHLDSQVEHALRVLLADMDRVLAQGQRAERIREGFRVALLGAPNVGKSSLLNALAGRDVAIVSPVAGTTRDRIEVMLDLKGIPVVVTDTAGLQETRDPVETEGIRRSLASAADADLILWLSAPDQVESIAMPAFSGVDVWRVMTKGDLPGAAMTDGLHTISNLTGHGIDSLVDRISDAAQTSLGVGEPPVMTRSRHRFLVETARVHLGGCMARDVPEEIIAEKVRLAMESMDRLVGRIDIEDVLGTIFSRFCIGK